MNLFMILLQLSADQNFEHVRNSSHCPMAGQEQNNQPSLPFVHCMVNES